MDIVDLASMILEILVKEVLQHADGQFALVLVQMHRTGFFADIPLDREASLSAAAVLQCLKKLFRLSLEDHAVNRLKDLRRVVDILQLNERIARRMVGKILTGMVLFQLFIAALGRCQRVVAVTNRKDHGHALKPLVLLAYRLGIARKRIVKLVNVFALNKPARNVAAALHQVKVIELFQVVFLRTNRLNEYLVMVVAEHQNVRQLDGCVAAHTLARRDALGNGALGCADGRGCTGCVVIRVQVNRADQSLADRAVFQRPLNIDIAVRIRGKHVFVHIFFHGGIDKRRVLGLFFRTELCLGKNQIDCGNRPLGVLTNTIPIRVIGSKLVAGNNRPLFHMVGLWHQDISR